MVFQSFPEGFFGGDPPSVLDGFWNAIQSIRAYSRTLWINEELGCLLLNVEPSNKVVLVAKTKKGLDEMKKRLEMDLSEKKKEAQVNLLGDFAEPFVVKGRFEENVFSGRIKLPGQKALIEASFELDQDAPKDSDFKKLIAKSEKMVALLTPAKQKEIKRRAAEKVTDAAYEQSDHQVTEKDYRKLENDLKLTELCFFNGGAILSYASPKIFLKELIHVQVNSKWKVDEVSVDS